MEDYRAEYQKILDIYSLPMPGVTGRAPTYEEFVAQRKRSEQRKQATINFQEGIKAEDYDKAYTEGFEKLPLMDQLLYSVFPGVGDVIAGYEIPEFAERGSKAVEEGRYLDAAGNYTISGLNVLSMIPFAGKAADLVETGAKAIKGSTKPKLTFKPSLDNLRITDTTGQYPERSMPLLYSSEVDLTNAVNSGVLDYSKKYPPNKIFKLASKYSDNPSKTLDELNLYTSTEFKNRPSATIGELQEEFNRLKPLVNEDNMFYYVTRRDSDSFFGNVMELEGLKNLDDIDNKQSIYRRFRKADENVGAYPFSLKPAVGYGEITLNVKGLEVPEFDSYLQQLDDHSELAQGNKIQFFGAPRDTKNRVAHMRYRLVPKVDKTTKKTSDKWVNQLSGESLVLELSEIQSDAYTFGQKFKGRTDKSDLWPLQRAMFDDNKKLMKALEDLPGFDDDYFFEELAQELGYKAEVSPGEVSTIFNKAFQKERVRAGYPDQFKPISLVQTEGTLNAIRLLQDFNKYRYDSYGGNLSKQPLAKNNQWFEILVKRGIQEGHKLQAEFVDIPINNKALIRQRGDVRLEKASDLADHYKRNTESSIKNIEKQYDIEITPTTVVDSYGQEFYRIKLNDDTKKLTEVLKLNKGGLVSLMPLKY